MRVIERDEEIQRKRDRESERERERSIPWLGNETHSTTRNNPLITTKSTAEYSS